MNAPLEATSISQDSAVRAVGKLLHKYPGHKLMAMLVAYLDESGVHSGSRVCAIAGFVGTEDEWATFERRWKRVLKDANVSTFHMAEFESRLGEFAGWSNMRRKMFLAELMEMIFDAMPIQDAINFCEFILKTTIGATEFEVGAPACGGPLQVAVVRPGNLGFWAGSAVIAADYEKLPEEDKRWMTHGTGLPYFLCFQHCVVEAAHYADHLDPDEKVAFVFDRQGELSGEATRLYNDLKDSDEWPNRVRLADAFAFASRRETVPLQAADIAAYESYKRVENLLYSPEHAERWPMKQLRMRPFRGKYFDAATLQSLLAKRTT